MSNNEILTSTGSLGIDRRTYDRIYWNSRWPITSLEGLQRAYARASLAINADDQSRIVGRFIMPIDLPSQIARQSSLADAIEVITPISNWEGNTVAFMGMGALNHATRIILDQTPENLIRARSMESSKKSLIGRVKSARDHGLQLVDQIEPWMIGQIYELWGEIFGWDHNGIEVENLSERLHRESKINGKNRSVWFSSILNGEKIMSLSMAERLNLPTPEGRTITIVESTEWCSISDARLKGLTSTSVIHLHAQVIDDLQKLELPPHIIAETNLHSASFYVGKAAGMEIPPSQFGTLNVNQVLTQNVVVNDGIDPVGLRDFVMMHLPFEGLITAYNDENRQIILRG